MRVNTSAGEELRFWLTRRLVRLLWPALVKALEADDLVRAQPDPAAKQAVLAFQQDQAVSQADFKTTFREDPQELPLGEAPMLVSWVQLAPAPKGGQLLRLGAARGLAAQLGLGQDILHALCRLLVQAVEKAQWDLGLELSRSTEDTGPRQIN